MSDYLGSLVRRALGRAEPVGPRLPGRFEPAAFEPPGPTAGREEPGPAAEEWRPAAPAVSSPAHGEVRQEANGERPTQPAPATRSRPAEPFPEARPETWRTRPVRPAPRWAAEPPPTTVPQARREGRASPQAGAASDAARQRSAPLERPAAPLRPRPLAPAVEPQAAVPARAERRAGEPPPAPGPVAPGPEPQIRIVRAVQPQPAQRRRPPRSRPTPEPAAAPPAQPAASPPSPSAPPEVIWETGEPLAPLGFEPLLPREVVPEGVAAAAPVHIHVGRVEVVRRAAHAPPPRPRPEPAPVLGLDEYLEQRGSAR